MKVNPMITFLLIIFLKILIETMYFIFVSPNFSYQGFVIDISIIKLFESYTFTGIIGASLVYLITKYLRPSVIILILLTIFLYLPLSSLYWIANEARIYYYSISFNLLFMIILVLKLPLFKIKIIKEGYAMIFTVVISITALVYIMIIFNGGLNRINFNLFDIYTTRESFVSSSNSILSYLLSWQAYVINMILLAFSLVKRNFKFIIIILAMQFLLFAMTGFRSFLFAPFLLIFINIFKNIIFKYNILFLLLVGTNLFLLIIIAIAKLNDNILLISIFIRRLFFVPANLHYTYFDFFEGGEKYKLSHSILSFLFDQPYPYSPIQYISNVYFERDSGANVGVFGDAYVNFGLSGIFLFSVVLVILMKFVDSITIGIPYEVVLSIMIIPSMSLINSALITSLVTHGLIFALIMIWLSNILFMNNEKKRSLTNLNL